MTAPLIAILDHDPTFLRVSNDLLAAAGYRTLRCRPRDAVGAHALVERFQPALVILDRWWRRGSEGWEFLKHLWADPRTAQIGVILTTGHPVGPSLQTDLLCAMRCRVVRSPLDGHELLRAIAAVLGPSFVGQVPDRRVAAVASPARVAAPATEAARRSIVAARAPRHKSRLLDAASDS